MLLRSTDRWYSTHDTAIDNNNQENDHIVHAMPRYGYMIQQVWLMQVPTDTKSFLMWQHIHNTNTSKLCNSVLICNTPIDSWLAMLLIQWIHLRTTSILNSVYETANNIDSKDSDYIVLATPRHINMIQHEWRMHGCPNWYQEFLMRYCIHNTKICNLCFLI